MLNETQEFVSRESGTAFATACGAGILLNLLPTRLLAGAISAVAVMLVRPALLTLGLLKAFELTIPKTKPDTH